MVESNPYQPSMELSEASDVPDREPNSDNVSVTWLGLAIVPLIPGLVLSAIFLLLLPINLLQGNGGWHFVPVTGWAVPQLAALAARLQASRRFANLSFNVWSLCSILGSITLIAFQRHYTTSADAPCGNAALADMLLEAICGGTILGTIMLWLSEKLDATRY